MQYHKIIKFSSKFPSWKSLEGSENLVCITVPNKNSETFPEKLMEGMEKKI